MEVVALLVDEERNEKELVMKKKMKALTKNEKKRKR